MYGNITANKRKTFILMTIFVGIVVALGWIISQMYKQPMITPFVLVGAAVYTLISYFAGSKMALTFSGAKEIQKSDNPRLWRIVENLSITEGLPMPKVYIINDPSPNAMATGRDPAHASVAATTGILDLLNDTELEGVMAHELGHVKNYDIRVSMIVFALVAVIGIIADLILRFTFYRDRDDEGSGGGAIFFIGVIAAIITPIIATFIQLAISRQREYLADATGAQTTRYPDGLASALEKIGAYGRPMARQNGSTAHLFFVNPLKGKGLANLLSTHPPIADRVNRLRSMGFDN